MPIFQPLSVGSFGDIVCIVQDLTTLYNTFSRTRRGEERQGFEAYLRSSQATCEFLQDTIPSIEPFLCEETKKIIFKSLTRYREYLRDLKEMLLKKPTPRSSRLLSLVTGCFLGAIEPVKWQWQKAELTGIEKHLNIEMQLIKSYLSQAIL